MPLKERRDNSLRMEEYLLLLLWGGATGEERVEFEGVDEMESGCGDLEVEGIMTMLFLLFLLYLLFRIEGTGGVALI